MIRDTILFATLIVVVTAGLSLWGHRQNGRPERARIQQCMIQARTAYPDEAMWREFEVQERHLCVAGF